MEMLVVIAVMAIILVLITNYGAPRSQWLTTQAAAHDIANAMRIARGQAIAQGRPVAFIMPRLPGGVSVSIAPPTGIVFAPDGSASGGHVTLRDAGRIVTINADWLTGQVHINAQ